MLVVTNPMKDNLLFYYTVWVQRDSAWSTLSEQGETFDEATAAFQRHFVLKVNVLACRQHSDNMLNVPMSHVSLSSEILLHHVIWE